MKYSETGKFTPKQVECAKNILKYVKQAHRLGMNIFCNESELQIFRSSEFSHSGPFGSYFNNDHKHPIPYLSGGYIDESGAPGEICFELGYITED